MKSINSSIKFKGFIIYDKLSNTILNIPRYDISGDMCRYLKGAFAENEKLKEIWDTYPIIGIEENIEDENEIYIKSKDIVIELLEYCIIDRLSTELQDYFRKPNMNFEKLEKIERKNISKDLLSNRFINIFTEEIKNREAFKDSKDEVEYNEKNGNELFYLEIFDSGEIYNKMQLIFPKNTKIKRNDNNSLQIDTKKYLIGIEFDFDGTGVIIDDEFEKYYLDIQNYFDENLDLRYHEYGFCVKVNVKYKLNTYFSKNKWKYYLWIENFIEDLEKYISMDNFMNEINWKSVRTILQCYKNSKKDQ